MPSPAVPTFSMSYNFFCCGHTKFASGSVFPAFLSDFLEFQCLGHAEVAEKNISGDKPLGPKEAAVMDKQEETLSGASSALKELQDFIDKLAKRSV